MLSGHVTSQFPRFAGSRSLQFGLSIREGDECEPPPVAPLVSPFASAGIILSQFASTKGMTLLSTPSPLASPLDRAVHLPARRLAAASPNDIVASPPPHRMTSSPYRCIVKPQSDLSDAARGLSDRNESRNGRTLSTDTRIVSPTAS
jgi:hypothetical protein